MNINTSIINNLLHTPPSVNQENTQENLTLNSYQLLKEYAQSKITTQQKNSLDEYTSTSYADINGYLNNKSGDTPFSNDIRNIDKAISTAGEFTGAVFRGSTRIAENINTGDLVTSPTFLSTSINIEDASRFNKGVMIAYHITEKGAALPVGSDYSEDESEVLLARDLIFKVDSKIEEPTRTTLVLKQISSDLAREQPIKDYRTGIEIVIV
ncbi:ADP-ribosyltransferase [Salmonella enterica]|nr:ADP-ribosyltransferase [Salmonella enterica]